MVKLSVVVPVYKVEKYLSHCVESILHQTERDLEVILVDDGSPDNCGAICDQYANRDSRVRVIHKPNGGLSDARNAGMEAAVGSFLAFVDSDDYIAHEMYEDMLREMQRNRLDIISCKAFRVKGERIIGDVGIGEIKVLDGKTVLLKALAEDYNVSAWNKIYKREVSEGVRFPKGRIFEDTATNYLFFAKADRIGELDRAYYYYRVNENSITQTSFKAAARWDFAVGYIERLEYAEQHNLPCITECKSLLMKAAMSCLTAVYAESYNDINREIFLKIENLVREHRSGEVYKLLNLKYKLFLWCFGRVDIIHKICSKISFWKKKIRSL